MNFPVKNRAKKPVNRGGQYRHRDDMPLNKGNVARRPLTRCRASPTVTGKKQAEFIFTFFKRGAL